MDEAADGANSVMTLLDVLFPVYYETLSYANLNAVRTSAGMAGIVRELAGIPDNATAHLNATAPEYFDGDMVTTLVEDISEYDPVSVRFLFLVVVFASVAPMYARVDVVVVVVGVCHAS